MKLSIEQYGHKGYQNDGSETIYKMMGLILKMSDMYEIFAIFFSSFRHTFSVAVTLTLDPVSPISIGFELVQQATI